MKKIIIFLSICITLILACNQRSAPIKIFDENKNHIKTLEYYPHKPQQIYKEVLHYINFDSVYVYYENGHIFKKGKQYEEGKKFGIWYLYDKEGNLREIREWFTVNGKSRANRVWHLSSQGDTLIGRYKDSIFNQKEFINDTTYFRYTVFDDIVFNKDTISVNEHISGYIEVLTPTIDQYKSRLRIMLAREENNFNYDFSNEKEVKLDTFYDLTADTINQQWFPDANPNQVAVFWQFFDSPGNKTLRGYYQEYYIAPSHKKNGQMIVDSVVGYKTYFEKKIYVKDIIHR